MNISSKLRISSALVLAIALGAANIPAEAASTGGPSGSASTNAAAAGNNTVVIVSIHNGPGTGHAIEATKIEVSRDKKTVDITIRDPECPNQTSKITVNVATQTITAHTGEPCHSYVGWKVRGYTRIKK